MVTITVDQHTENSITEAEALSIVEVPQSVTALQGLLAIDAAGIAEVYEAWANDPARTFAEKAFINRAQVWNRNDPLMIGAAAALGLSETQLDDLFILGAKL